MSPKQVQSFSSKGSRCVVQGRSPSPSFPKLDHLRMHDFPSDSNSEFTAGGASSKSATSPSFYFFVSPSPLT